MIPFQSCQGGPGLLFISLILIYLYDINDIKHFSGGRNFHATQAPLDFFFWGREDDVKYGLMLLVTPRNLVCACYVWFGHSHRQLAVMRVATGFCKPDSLDCGQLNLHYGISKVISFKL